MTSSYIKLKRLQSLEKKVQVSGDFVKGNELKNGLTGVMEWIRVEKEEKREYKERMNEDEFVLIWLAH